jgi:hypothetical protein
VTDVSSSSLTVKSSDGYTHTYKVVPTTVVDSQAGGISSVAKNDQVDLLATPQNGSDTATNIVDRTKVGASRQGFGFGRAKPAPAPGGAPGSSNSSANFGGFPGGPAPGASGQLQ